MVHCLAVRRGNVSILCNGRPSIDPKGVPTNRFKGDPKILLDAIGKTSGNGKRILIPQTLLSDKVNCEKCSSLMDPKSCEKYMRKIYKNSSKWKTRRAERKIRMQRIERMEPKNHEVCHGGSECTAGKGTEIHVPQGKTLVLSISII